MLEPTLTTWILIIFGLVFIFLPILYVQLQMVLRSNSRKTRDIIIGKGEYWRDKTHFRMSLGAGWADLMIWLPILAAGSVGVILGQVWGYALWAASGAISVYVNIILWFSEREYVYPACGPLVYYTYLWGFFVYWGVAVVVYTVLRLAGVTL
jgi:hypothetical protein